jgi:glycosidase
MMFYLRGVPVIYYGDEQGFISDGNDKAAREDMFPSLVDSFNDNDLLGTDDTTASANFNTKHPFYRALSKMARTYSKHAPLRRGAQLLRVAEHEGSLLAVSRLDEDGGEYLIIFNAEPRERTLQINVDPRSTSWKSISGRCNRKSTTIGSVEVTTPPLAYVICKSNDWN